MSRTQNIRKNLIFNMVKYVTNLLLQFVLRTILIYYMGAEYLGLNGLFSNIFSFLNLAELGIGSAIGFSMYKPIAENDIEKVKSLQDLYKKCYLFIFLIVLFLGVSITPFINIFIKNELTIDINIYLLFIMYLINTLCGYFSAHKRSLLFAYQRNDLENKIKTLCLFGMVGIQILLIILFKNYYVYYSITIIFTIIECVLVNLIANKHFPELKGKGEKLDNRTKKDIRKNIVALSLHKVGGAVVFSTDSILISIFCGVVVIGAHSNYNLIISSVASLFMIFNNSLMGSVGNLIAKSDIEYTYKKYRQINFCYSYLSSFTTICLLVLLQPFITIWTGGGVYMLDFSTVIILCFSYYLSRMRGATNIFKETAGLFWQNKWMPIVESLVNLIVSIVLGLYLGINGIFIGTIISTLVAPFWVEPLVLHRHYFKRSCKEYFGRYILDAIIMIASAVICYFICSLIPTNGILWLIIKFIVCIGLSNVLLICVYFPTKEFKELLEMLQKYLRKILKKNKTSVSKINSGINDDIDTYNRGK